MANTTVNTSPLLVPFYLDAFVANSTDGLYKDISLDLDNLKNYDNTGALGTFVEKDVIANNNTAFYASKPGVHLHWVLPKGFRHGVYRKGYDDLDFPLAPNRWLIVRTDAQLQVKAWVLESDFVDKTATNGFNWMQLSQIEGNNSSSSKKYVPAKIGRALPLQGWQETKTDALFLKVIAPGDPSFAAAYLHSKNVFGFYDNMDGVADGSTFSYRVFGWFSDPGADPLAGLDTLTKFNSKLDEYGWLLTDADKLPQLPGSILCHSAIYGVLYGKNPITKKPSLSDISLGIGNSVSEALGAMLSDRLNSSQLGFSKKLLAAFQYQNIKDNGFQPDGLVQLKKEMHKRAFNKVDGGTVWLIEQNEKDTDALKDPRSGDGQNQKAYTSPFDDTISGMLLALNNAQGLYNDKFDDLKASQEELYAALYKKSYANFADTGDISDADWEKIGGDGGLLDQNIARLKAGVLALSNTLNGLKRNQAPANTEPVWPASFTGTIPDLYNKLVAAIGADAGMKDYQVKEAPADKYYQSAEPAIVINGLFPSSKYIDNYQVKDNPSAGNALIERANTVCRVSGLADTISITLGGNTYKVPVERIFPKSRLLDVDPGNAGLLNIFTAILGESVLLDPKNAAAIAFAIKNDHGDMTEDELNRLTATIADTIIDFNNHPESFLNGTSPAQLPANTAVAMWQQPWVPLYMEWGVEWAGINGGTTDNYLPQWAFGNESNQDDYALEAAGTNSSPAKFFGRTILSTDLVNKVADLNQKLGGDSSSELFQTMKPMSQNLSGLFAQLLNRYHGLQLPLLDNGLNFLPDNDFLSGHYPWSPKPGEKQFSPLRSGMFKVAMLRIIDAFGQVLEILTPASVAGPGVPQFKNSASLAKNGADFILPPRMVQPARIRFDWLSAADDGRVTDSDPSTNPVCGWLLTNKLDNSVMVYDADGIEAGELRNVRGTVKLLQPPGGSQSKLNNQRLNNLIDNIKKSPDNFNALVGQLAKVVSKVRAGSSRQQFAMALPVGLPVAVVGAQLTLEVKGLPAVAQYWAADGDATFTKAAFKTYLGDINNKNDGLIGYYDGKGGDALKLPFLQKKAATQTTAFLQEDAPLSLQIGKTCEITALMDPRSVLTVTSGILPAAGYELPAHAVVKPLQNISVRFLAAPIITPRKLTMPLLQSEEIQWEWMPGVADVNVTPEPEVPDSNVNDLLTFDKLYAAEGWLKVSAKQR